MFYLSALESIPTNDIALRILLLPETDDDLIFFFSLLCLLSKLLKEDLVFYFFRFTATKFWFSSSERMLEFLFFCLGGLKLS